MALNFPVSPVDGQIYYDATSGNRYVYDAATTKWSYTANNTPTGSVYLSASAPPGAVAGDLWWHQDLGTMFIFYNDGDSTQWVETSPSGGFSDVAASLQTINAAFGVANAAFDSANNVAPQVAPSYNTANAAFSHSNVTYDAVNSAFAVINAAYTSSNADYVLTNSAYTFANSVNTFAYGVAVNAAAAFAAANNVAPQVTPAFNTANAAYTVANSAYTFANGVATNTTAAFGHSNLTYNAVNSAFGVINAAYTSSNAGYVVTNAAYTTANAGFTAANNAGTVANNANTYAASTYVKKVGDTITGDLVVQGNVTISGNTTYANTQTLLIGDNIITLNNDIPAAVAPSEDAGIEVKRGSSANVSVLWREGNDSWTITNDGTTWYSIATNTDVSTVYAAVNSAFGVINAAYTSSNSDYAVSNAAFAKANAALANTSGVYFAGDLNIPGKLYITSESADSIRTRFISGKATSSTANGNLYLNYGYSDFVQVGSGSVASNFYVANGNIGIGNTYPFTKLAVHNAATVGTGASQMAALSPIIYVDNGQANNGSIVIKTHGIQSGNTLGAIRFAASPDATNYTWAGMACNAGSGGAAASLIFYNANNNTLGASSYERMRIAENGNVGIATNNPGYTLDVAGDVRSNTVYRLENGTVTANWQLNGTAESILNTVSNHPMAFRTNNTERMRIDATGNVLIGTATATSAYPMTVYDSINGGIAFRNPTGFTGLAHNGNDFYFDIARGTAAAGNLVFRNSSSLTENMRITNTGNIGIAINTPGLGASGKVLELRPTDSGAVGQIRVGDYNNAGSIVSLIESFGTRSDDNNTFQGRFGASYRKTNGTVISTQQLGTYAFGAQWGTDATYQVSKHLYSASINGVAEGSFTSASAMPTAITFRTGSAGTDLRSVNVTYGDTERMRITSTGNVGIGNTTPVLKLEVAGNMSVDTFIENSANITTSYTITTGRNAMTAGPVTLNSGVTITVPAGSTWTVV